MKNKTTALPRLRFPEFRNEPKWEVKRLEDACSKITQGGTPDTSNSNYWNGLISWLTPLEMGRSQSIFISKTNRNITNEGLKSCSSDLLPVNSVILSTRAPIGHLAINKSKMAINQGCKGLIPKKTTDYNYLYYLLSNSKSLFINLGAGSTFKELRGNVLKNVRLLFPSLEEQKKIADCLSSIDELIASQKEKLEALQEHKKGLTQNLFPQEDKLLPRLRFPEFRNEPKWEVERLGDKAPFFLKGKGLSKKAITSNGRKHCIHYGELFTEYSEVIDSVNNRTNEIENSVLSAENDVLMPDSDVTPNGLAKACCIKINNVILGGGIIVIRADKSLLNGEFLSRLIRQRERQVLQLVSGSTVFHLYASSLKKLELPFTSLFEQKKIADCLSSIDELITAQKEKLETLQEHKKGLMQQLFPKTNEVLL